MRKESEPQLQALLKSGPAGLDGWLRQFEDGTVSPDSRMDGVSEVATRLAREHSSLEWADIAIRAANLWAKIDAVAREQAFQRAMLLRAWFISKMGAVQGNPVLDMETVLNWFYGELHLSIDEAKHKIHILQEARFPARVPLPKTEILELRKIKNRLAVVSLLAECGQLPASAEASAWLAIRNQLP